MDGPITPLVATEIALALIVTLIVGVFLFVWARRRVISGDGRPVMLCARRSVPSGRWRLGLARLGQARFEWFSVIGPSFAPEVAWVRHDMELGVAEPLSEPIPGLNEPVHVVGSCAGQIVHFAFAPAAYTALRAWLESSPPGVNVNVA